MSDTECNSYLKELARGRSLTLIKTMFVQRFFQGK